MNKKPLTNMEHRYVAYSKEAIEALIDKGYKENLCLPIHYILLDGNYIIGCDSIPSVAFELAYFHKGHFYGQPYEEEGAGTESRTPFPEQEDVAYFTEPRKLLKEIARIGEMYDKLKFRILKEAYESGADVQWVLKEKRKYLKTISYYDDKNDTVWITQKVEVSEEEFKRETHGSN